MPLRVHAGHARRRGNRIGERPLLFEIDRERGLDIDEELDFTVAEALFARRSTRDWRRAS